MLFLVSTRFIFIYSDNNNNGAGKNIHKKIDMSLCAHSVYMRNTMSVSHSIPFDSFDSTGLLCDISVAPEPNDKFRINDTTKYPVALTTSVTRYANTCYSIDLRAPHSFPLSLLLTHQSMDSTAWTNTLA